MKRSVVYITHIIYWSFYLLLIFLAELILLHGTKEFSALRFFNIALLSPFTCLVFAPALLSFYTYYGILFRRYYLQKRIAQLLGYGSGLSLLIALFTLLLIFLLFGKESLFKDGIYSFSGILLFAFLISLFHGVVGLVLRGFITSYSDISVKKELQQKNMETEMALIKAQIDPHFLFNTINNIDVLIHKNPALASDYLNRLSDILRFALYEVKNNKISLEKELQYIVKYIDLQKIRTANAGYVSFDVLGSPAGRSIEPMLFIPFIENAFKHSEDFKSSGKINIRFELSPGHIGFQCSNPCHPVDVTHKTEGGIGQAITVRRLELLYPQKHNLEIEQAGGQYTVKLKVLTDEH